jgi:DNA-binding transcriptional regulator YhcF (GntR family)
MTQSPPAGSLRIVGRAVVKFLLRALQVSAALHDGNLLASVIFLALSQAEAEKGGRNSNAKRPISVRSIAISLDIPYETARRQLAGLAARGLCERRDKLGYVTSDSASARSFQRRHYRRNAAAFIDMLREMKSVGFNFRDVLGGTARQRAGLRGAGAAVEIERIAGGLILRFVEAGMAPHGRNLDRAAVFVAIGAANTQALWQDPALSRAYSETVPPDTLRRPVSAREVARMLSMPAETARRYVNALLRDGVCEKVGDRGVIVPGRIHQRADMVAIGVVYVTRLAQALVELERAGIDAAALESGSGKS